MIRWTKSSLTILAGEPRRVCTWIFRSRNAKEKPRRQFRGRDSGRAGASSEVTDNMPRNRHLERVIVVAIPAQTPPISLGFQPFFHNRTTGARLRRKGRRQRSCRGWQVACPGQRMALRPGRFLSVRPRQAARLPVCRCATSKVRLTIDGRCSLTAPSYFRQRRRQSRCRRPPWAPARGSGVRRFVACRSMVDGP